MVSFQVMYDSEAIDDSYSLVNSGRGDRPLIVVEYYTETVQTKRWKYSVTNCWLKTRAGMRVKLIS